jgi:hypothetical protein
MALAENTKAHARQLGEQSRPLAPAMPQTGLNLGNVRNSTSTPEQTDSGSGRMQGQLSSDRQEYPTPSSQG